MCNRRLGTRTRLLGWAAFSADLIGGHWRFCGGESLQRILCLLAKVGPPRLAMTAIIRILGIGFELLPVATAALAHFARHFQFRFTGQRLVGEAGRGFEALSTKWTQPVEKWFRRKQSLDTRYRNGAATAMATAIKNNFSLAAPVAAISAIGTSTVANERVHFLSTHVT